MPILAAAALLVCQVPPTYSIPQAPPHLANLPPAAPVAQHDPVEKPVGPTPKPVFEMNLEGKIRLRKGRLDAKICPGTSAVPTHFGTGFQFGGPKSGILLGDVRALRLTKSLSIAAWVNLETYVFAGPGAQIVFRGDDRIGIDPYHLHIQGDGRVYFAVESGKDSGWVAAPVPLRQWTHILGSLDDKTGKLLLWINGVKVAEAKTNARPFGNLDPMTAPGVSIGNIQNDRGPHNQPLRGTLARVEIYDRAVTPAEIRLAIDHREG